MEDVLDFGNHRSNRYGHVHLQPAVLVVAAVVVVVVVVLVVVVVDVALPAWTGGHWFSTAFSSATCTPIMYDSQH